MKITRRQNLGLIGATALAAGTAPYAAAQGGTVHEVQMLNQHPDDPRERQVFHPAVVRAQPGDTIRWIPTDRGHNTVTDEELIPEGAEAWRARINEEFEVTLDVEGTYAYYCQPHQTVGMVGLILVGDARKNLEEVQSVRKRGRARDRYEQYFAEAEEILESETS